MDFLSGDFQFPFLYIVNLAPFGSRTFSSFLWAALIELIFEVGTEKNFIDIKVLLGGFNLKTDFYVSKLLYLHKLILLCYQTSIFVIPTILQSKCDSTSEKPFVAA